jgi:site-specific DNA recombinase
MRVIRPGWQTVLDLLRGRQAGWLLAEDLDRVVRDPRDLEDLIDVAEGTKANARSKSGSLTLTDGGTDAEITMARVMVTLANKSSRDTGRRVRDEMSRMRTDGRFTGGPRPFGREADGRTIREDEAEMVRAATRAVLTGEALYAITRAWNAVGMKTPRGKVWSSSSVKAVLLRPSNAGLHGNSDDPRAATERAPFVPLLDEDRDQAETLWRAVVEILLDPARRTNGGAPPRWLGSGLYLCGGCLRPTLAVQGAKQRYYCQVPYRWPGSVDPAVQHVKRKAGPLDAFVEWALVSRLSKPDAVDLFAPAAPDVDVAGLRAESSAIKKQRETQLSMHGRGLITDAELERTLTETRTRLTELDTQLAPTSAPDVLRPVFDAADVVKAWFGEGPERVGGFSLETRRAILGAVATVTVLPVVERGAHEFDPDSVRIDFKGLTRAVDSMM